MPDRRSFLLASAALIASAANGQARNARIGYLASTDPKRSPGMEQFLEGLRKLGWVEGKNLSLDYRWGASAEELQKHAAELVRTKVDLLFTWGSPATAAAKRATSTIPVVFTWLADPVGAGFVSSLARPGGNLTGMTNSVRELSAKNVSVFADAIPAMRRIGLVRNPDNPNARLVLQEAEAAARSRALEHHVFDVRAPTEFAALFDTMIKQRIEGATFLGDPMILAGRRQLADLAMSHRLPSIYNNIEYVHAGGLMSYGPDPRDVFRHTATFVDRVLRGAKPADLPVEQPTIMKLAFNLKTAKALGLSLPQSVLVHADEIVR